MPELNTKLRSCLTKVLPYVTPTLQFSGSNPIRGTLRKAVIKFRAFEIKYGFSEIYMHKAHRS